MYLRRVWFQEETLNAAIRGAHVAKEFMLQSGSKGRVKVAGQYEFVLTVFISDAT